jgi:hypothetical protein
MTTEVKPANGKPANVNRIGLTQQEYRGGESTLCQGCGHNSITAQIIAAAYDLSLQPSQIIKVSGIGCSSKTPAYFLNRSHGFNTLHGRMPSVATGAILAIARIAGETAPLLFTAFGNRFWSTSLTNPIASLTVQVYTYAISPFPDWQRQAWAGALVLTTIVLALELGVRWMTRGSARVAR